MEATLETYWIGYGLTGYGPELDEESEPVALADLPYYLHTELHSAADHAEVGAHALADSGDFEGAWREHERADSLACLAENYNPDRQRAPLYRDNPEAWLETVRTLTDQAFPLDVGEHSRLYVWPVPDDAFTTREEV